MDKARPKAASDRLILPLNTLTCYVLFRSTQAQKCYHGAVQLFLCYVGAVLRLNIIPAAYIPVLIRITTTCESVIRRISDTV